MRKSIKRNLIALLLISAMTLSITACMDIGNPFIPSPEDNSSSSTTPKPGAHVCVFGGWETVKPATNTEDGLRERRCECGEVEQEVIEASNKEYAIHYKNLKSAAYPSETGYNSKDGLLNLPVPEAEGYEFIGWFTASIGGDIVDYIPKGSNKDYVLFAQWKAITYDITYKNVPNNTNPTTYNIEDKLKLETPKWSGLVFTHWSDESGTVYKPEENMTFLPENMSGDLVLTANWKVLRNVATPAEQGAELYNSFSSEDGFLYFFYDLGTIEHVVLDNINPDMYYKYEGFPITLTLSKTVSVTEEKAQSIANTVSKSVTSTSSWSGTKSFSETESKNWNAQVGGGIEGTLGSGALMEKVCNWEVKAKVEGHYNWGGGTDTTNGWTNTMSGSSGESSSSSKTVSTSIAYKEEMTSEITESITIEKDLPSGYYAYVHAGNIRVIAVASYEISTGYLYISTYSRLDNMHSMIMYYADVNQLNNPSVEGLDFKIPEDEIKDMIESSYYIKYDANGGTGTMATTIHGVDVEGRLPVNQFKKEGYLFAGWELTTADGVSVLLDGQSVKNIGKALETITLKALWTEDPTYQKDVIYTLTTKTGSISSSPAMTYSAAIEYRNRTASSVEIRVKWTTTIKKGYYTRYGQNFNFTIGSQKSGNVKVLSFDSWKNYTSSARSSTGTSAWITVPMNTANATTLSMKVYYWQTNSNNLDMYKYDGTACVDTTWTLNIPAN
ncbi:MAG: InlB B-repeat-containing protein [Clostridia bacterium]|nr:InlB B-repeat-containing protein [Clostridia bacterium]